MLNDTRFHDALYALPVRIKDVLLRLPKSVKQSAEEIRLRAGLPVTLTVSGETVFVRENGEASFYLCNDLFCADSEDTEQCFLALCGGSVYAHGEELKNGYIMMKNGCRAGVCGTLTEKGFMRDITSVNIRIAREITGAANDIIPFYNGGGLLIAGAPGSGKTTVLRDLIRQLSGGFGGRFRRIAVIDSRGELSGGFGGGRLNDLGSVTDVLMTCDKAAGIEIAVRTMFPDIIAFDEIGSAQELKKVSESFHSGVSVITTAHIGSPEELMERSVTRELILSRAVEQVALLPRLHGGTVRIINAKELLCAVV